jgi:hypothetical protein
MPCASFNRRARRQAKPCTPRENTGVLLASVKRWDHVELDDPVLELV